MSETRTHMLARLKAQRRAAGIGEFRGKRKVFKHHAHRSVMAKRRSRSRKSVGSTSSLVGSAVGVAAYILYEAAIEPKVASFIGTGTVLNVVELAAGVWLSRKGGWMGNVGKAAVVINLYQLVKPMFGGMSGVSTGSIIYN